MHEAGTKHSDIPSSFLRQRKQDIAKAFFDGFAHKPQSTVFTCNEDICTHFIRGYQRKKTSTIRS